MRALALAAVVVLMGSGAAWAQKTPGADFAASDGMVVPFEDYPVEVRTRQLAAPVITAENRAYRTRIRQAAEDGVNFAGRYTLMRFGCGTGCSGGYLIDRASGEVTPFPLGGDRHASLTVGYRPDSRVLWASWGPLGGGCTRQNFLMGDAGLEPLGEAWVTAGPPDSCGEEPWATY